MDDVSGRVGSMPDQKSYALSGKIMLSAIVVLFFVVVVVIALHLYARWYLLRARRRQLLRRRSRLNHGRRAQIVFYVDNNPTSLIASDPANCGLEPAVLNSLPRFVYSPKTHPKVMDCAVCLSEFEENEVGRILPKCKHLFHIECIDMWFQSHSTCPLCRAPVENFSEAVENSNSDVIVELGEPESSRTEPGSSSSELCSACKHEDGDRATSSLGARRKGIDFTGVRIDIPMRSELENELTLSSPANQAFKSPGTRLLSLKRILSMGRKTPTTPPTGAATTPCGAGTSCGLSASEIELERGTTELTRGLTPR